MGLIVRNINLKITALKLARVVVMVNWPNLFKLKNLMMERWLIVHRMTKVIRKKKCKLDWFKEICVLSCPTPVCGPTEPLQVEKPDKSETNFYCAQENRHYQKKKCAKDWFRKLCVISCCEKQNNTECNVLTEPTKVEKPDGSGKQIDCNQSKRSDQQDKCSKDWFREVCSKSCCAIGFPPVVKDPECENVLTEPTKVEKPDGSGKQFDCNQSERSDQKDKCSKDWFREVCSKSCCAIGFPPVVKDPKCEVLTEPTKIEKPDGS